MTDSYDRELYNDILICENVHENYGLFIIDQLNKEYSGSGSDWYYRLVEDDYKLFERDY